MDPVINISAAADPTAPPTGYVFTRLYILTDTKFHTLTAAANFSETNTLANTTAGSATTISMGLLIEGRFTAVKIHSGLVRAHCGK